MKPWMLSETLLSNHAGKLHEALSDLYKIFNRMESLGSPADPNLKFTLLNQMVSELVTRTDMVDKLTIHISNCEH